MSRFLFLAVFVVLSAPMQVYAASEQEEDAVEEGDGSYFPIHDIDLQKLEPASGDEASVAGTPERLQAMKYQIYTGGINVVQGDLEIDMRGEGRYSVMLGAETKGFLSSFVPWRGTFQSVGWAMKDGKRRPELHESIALWRQEEEIKSYHYNKKGKFLDLVTTYTKKKPKVTEPEAELTDGTTDILSATLSVMERIAAGEKCNSSADIFDGKRRFEMIFRDQGRVVLPYSRYNIYSGPATQCTVEVKPQAGEWHKKPRGWLSIQEQGRAAGTMPTVWFAKIGESHVAVPVRIMVKTSYGALFMHLTEYKNGGEILVAEKN